VSAVARRLLKDYPDTFRSPEILEDIAKKERISRSDSMYLMSIIHEAMSYCGPSECIDTNRYDKLSRMIFNLHEEALTADSEERKEIKVAKEDNGILAIAEIEAYETAAKQLLDNEALALEQDVDDLEAMFVDDILLPLKETLEKHDRDIIILLQLITQIHGLR